MIPPRFRTYWYVWDDSGVGGVEWTSIRDLWSSTSTEHCVAGDNFFQYMAMTIKCWESQKHCLPIVREFWMVTSGQELWGWYFTYIQGGGMWMLETLSTHKKGSAPPWEALGVAACIWGGMPVVYLTLTYYHPLEIDWPTTVAFKLYFEVVNARLVPTQNHVDEGIFKTLCCQELWILTTSNCWDHIFANSVNYQHELDGRYRQDPLIVTKYSTYIVPTINRVELSSVIQDSLHLSGLVHRLSNAVFMSIKANAG